MKVYEPSMEETKRITAVDVKEEALQFLLASGQNTVSWDDCELIWDSANILSEAPQNNPGVAVFGVKGRLSTPQPDKRSFLLRHSFNFGPEEGYFMKAALGSGSNGSSPARLEVRPGQNSTDRGSQDFERAVRQLTEQVWTNGALQAIRKFMTLDIARENS